MARIWNTIKEYEDILFEQYGKIAKITINRPQVYNAFRPQTNFEMLDAVSSSLPAPVTRHSVRVATKKLKG